MISEKKYTRGQFVVPPLGCITPPKGGTTNFDLHFGQSIRCSRRIDKSGEDMARQSEPSCMAQPVALRHLLANPCWETYLLCTKGE
ncbi:hypothetical protein QUF80_00675 [Desulfococcaceae bacterium HSG8]|nr:hypothetical protein [Desulfococcaceae bacterium HSG8]